MPRRLSPRRGADERGEVHSDSRVEVTREAVAHRAPAPNGPKLELRADLAPGSVCDGVAPGVQLLQLAPPLLGPRIESIERRPERHRKPLEVRAEVAGIR